MARGIYGDKIGGVVSLTGNRRQAYLVDMILTARKKPQASEEPTVASLGLQVSRISLTLLSPFLHFTALSINSPNPSLSTTSTHVPISPPESTNTAATMLSNASDIHFGLFNLLSHSDPSFPHS